MKTTGELGKGTKRSNTFQSGGWERHPLQAPGQRGLLVLVKGVWLGGGGVAGRKHSHMPSEGSGLEWGVLSRGNLVVFFPKKAEVGIMGNVE